MKNRDLIEELFNGEGALPRPSPQEVDDLSAVVDNFAPLAHPLPSPDLQGKMGDFIRAHQLTADLFTGEGALPPSSTEETAGFEETLLAFTPTRVPQASGQIAGKVRRFIRHRNRLRSRMREEEGLKRVITDFRLACRQSSLLKVAAAILLIQAISLPLVGAYTAYRTWKHGTSTARTGMTPHNLSNALPEPEIEITPEYVSGEVELHLEDPVRPDQVNNQEFQSWLRIENELRGRWHALSQRIRPDVRLKRLKKHGIPLALDRLINKWSMVLAQDLEKQTNPMDLAVGIRALVLSGNTERLGKHAPFLRKAVPMLLAAWEKSDFLSRLSSAAALAELNILTGGAHRKSAARAVRWCAKWSADPDHLATLPTWALADAAEILEWAPLFSNLRPSAQRLLIENELTRRALRGGSAGEDAAAALLRSFPTSPGRDEAMRLTMILRSHPGQCTSKEPWTLIHLAWGLFPPSGAWAQFNESLRSLAFGTAPKGFRERALWVMALSVYYSAPEEHRR